MIFICDNNEEVRKVSQMMDKNIQERIQNLNHEDRVIFQKFGFRFQFIQQYYGPAPLQFLNQYSQAQVVDQQLFLRNFKKEQTQIQQNEESNSDTQSLSIISDECQFNLIEIQQWQQVLKQYGNLFKDYAFSNLIKTEKSLDYFFNLNKYVQQNYYNKVYLGFTILTKEWVVVKEQELQNQSLIYSAQQFVIHNYIYQLYPNNFLKLHLPVYIKIENDKLKFISYSEQGLIDLYQYSQQRLIPDLELHLIFQQIFEQIQLLHTHKIAHRDIKPQNIIYVEKKGWVLCDFEFSFKYINVIEVYDITGTYAFLLPQLQEKSKIQGVQVKQNLLQNDQYAFAITYIVIKYQLKTQEQIDQYLQNPKDPFGQFMLKSVQLQDLQKYFIIYEIKHIRPFLKQNQKQDQSFQSQEQIEFEITLGKLNKIEQICNQSNRELLNYIDEILKQNNSYFHYYHIQCYQLIPEYVNQLKNIIKYQQLRTRKYWNKMFYKLQPINNQQEIINSLYFMYNIGLTDLFIYYAKQFIKIQYNFKIHLLIIDIEHFFQNYEEVQNQFNILLKHRDFQYMNQSEQQLFIGQAIRNRNVQLTQKEIEYFQSLEFRYKYFNSIDFLLNHYQDDRFLEQVISYIQKIMKEQDVAFPFRLKFIQNFTNHIILLKDLQTSLKLLEALKQKLLKYQCLTLDWLNLTKMIIQFNELLGNNNNKKLIKNMNYVMMFNSESTLQQDLLKFQINSIQLYQNSCKKSFKIKIIHKIYHQVKNLSKCFKEFYICCILKELLSVLQVGFYKKILFDFFFIIVYVSKQNKLSQVLTQDDQEQLQELFIETYKQTNNKNRIKLLAKDRKYIILNERNLVIYKQIKFMNDRFIQNQYLYR